MKKNCSDPQDSGELCWPQSTQAYVLGSYFYGYTAQILAALIAKHLIGWFHLCHIISTQRLLYRQNTTESFYLYRD